MINFINCKDLFFQKFVVFRLMHTHIHILNNTLEKKNPDLLMVNLLIKKKIII
jgi:hypothetical protein